MAIIMTKVFYVYSNFHLTAESNPRLFGFVFATLFFLQS